MAQPATHYGSESIRLDMIAATLVLSGGALSDCLIAHCMWICSLADFRGS
jgi:hypothetical protein